MSDTVGEEDQDVLDLSRMVPASAAFSDVSHLKPTPVMGNNIWLCLASKVKWLKSASWAETFLIDADQVCCRASDLNNTWLIKGEVTVGTLMHF